MTASPDLVVVGAGVMGVWVAHEARAAGRDVLLVDAYGPGNARGSSGDETRITRAAHGDDAFYAHWARRSLERWRACGEAWGTRLFEPVGMLWFAHRDDGFEAAAARVFDFERIPHERLDPDELRRRWPGLGTDDLRFALYEPEAGALMARRGTMAAAAAFERMGGRYLRAGVRPGQVDGGRLSSVVTTDGTSIAAETFVFACGPWLPRLFPEVLGDVIRVTKQDVLLFGPAAGAHGPPTAWCDYDEAFYGIPGIDGRGVKVAPDRYGPIFDPSNGERLVDADSVRLARAYLRRRFPDLAAAPVVETRVCQYETTPDGHFLIDRHPDLDGAWLVGGGSGHGFKHGPRIGEYVVARLDGAAEGEQDGPGEARFRLGPRSTASHARTGSDEMARSWTLF